MIQDTRFKIQDTRYLVVVHDDIDLPTGTVRVSQGSGSAGHKGVESIIQQFGTNEFTRIRIGILPERGKPQDVENFVLRRFLPEDEGKTASAIQRSCIAIETILTQGTENAIGTLK